MRNAWIPYAEKNAPRYTSYPTAAQFSDSITSSNVSEWAQAIPPQKPISLYVHVPFCEQLCWYCGCHTTIPNGYDRISRYFQTLMKEIDLVASNLGSYEGVSHLHFGGGTPNALSDEDMLTLLDKLRRAFKVLDDAEVAIELDPRTLNLQMIRSLAAGGVSRASLGVQDFDGKVQRTVNRVQPFELVKQSVEWLRNWEIKDINFDLLYGLPFQTPETVKETALKAIELQPDRISAFGYAHIPWFAKHQKAIDGSALPNLHQRFDLYHIISETLVQNDYIAIGLDHFAKKSDPLSTALTEKRLQRNFQGYTDDTCDTLIALGPSGISELPAGFCQNEKNIKLWTEHIERGNLSITRGVAINRDDALRREVISELMCYLEVDFGIICEKYGFPVEYLDESLTQLQALSMDGLCYVARRKITVPETARIMLRSVAQTFDKHYQLQSANQRHAKAV